MNSHFAQVRPGSNPTPPEEKIYPDGARRALHLAALPEIPRLRPADRGVVVHMNDQVTSFLPSYYRFFSGFYHPPAYKPRYRPPGPGGPESGPRWPGVRALDARTPGSGVPESGLWSPGLRAPISPASFLA